MGSVEGGSFATPHFEGLIKGFPKIYVSRLESKVEVVICASDLCGPRSEALKTEKIKEEKDVHHQAITTSKGTQTEMEVEDDDDGEDFSAQLHLGAHGTISGDYAKRVIDSDKYLFQRYSFF